MLDPVTAYSIDGLIKEVDSSLHATSVVVTHDLNSAMRVADRIVFLHEGAVIADAPPDTFTASTDRRVREIVEKAMSEELPPGPPVAKSQ